MDIRTTAERDFKRLCTDLRVLDMDETAYLAL